MCGIAGIYSNEIMGYFEQDLVKQMNHIQRHRGPDDEGIYNNNHCILGHKRLSIIDLSTNGHQPFHSEDNRYHLTYNGEIYNYIELRKELISLGWNFRTKNDVEVLLKSYIQYGAACLNKFNGMFAFAIFDSVENSMFIARDRYGIKPFYYINSNNRFYFASEIKALRLVPEINFQINNQTLFDFLCFNRTDIFDETFYSEINRLPKGHYGVLNKNGFQMHSWWNSENYIKDITTDDKIYIYPHIRELLISAVKLRMRSDVPIGSCLSGGLDSSIITGIIFQQALAKNNYKTFTAAFPGYKKDETAYVDMLNKKYPFKNYRTYPDAVKAFNNFEDFIFISDEPSNNPSYFAQYEVMRLAKENNITVLLDGQGGDENFAGYQYFHGFNFTELYKRKKIIPLLKELSSSFQRKQDYEAFQTFLFQVISVKMKKKLLLKTLPHIQPDFFNAYIDNSKIFNEFFAADSLNLSIAKHFQYKLEHLLRMEDRTSMAFQIEARVPYLDYRLVEYMLGIPGSMKIKKGENKILQKKSVGDFSIPEILNRKDKIGFDTPGIEWMKTPEWLKATNEHYDFLIERFPEIFKKNVHLKENLYERWKINQLAIWHQMDFKTYVRKKL